MIARLAAVAAALLATGCPQILGLDDTRFEPAIDAPEETLPDAPSVCDGAPRCTATTGRSVCGQLVGTGDLAGVPLRIAEPTGEVCGDRSDGPCAFQIAGANYAELGIVLEPAFTQGTIDDCGRFVIPDMDPLIEVAAVLSGSDHVPTATLVDRASTDIGTDLDVPALAVSMATLASWQVQTGADPAPDMSSGYLLAFRAFGTGARIPGVQVAKEDQTPFMQRQDPPAMIGVLPWAVYFGEQPFGAVDSSATFEGTRASATAFAILDESPVSLDGQRVGRRCAPRVLHGVAGALLFVTLKDC